MKDFATLPETLEVKGLTLSTLEVADRKDNFGNTLFVITDHNALYARGNNEIVEGKSYVRADYLLQKFYAADDRIKVFADTVADKDLVAAQAAGLISNLEDCKTEDEIKSFVSARTNLRNRTIKNLVSAAANIDLTYHKVEKVNEVDGSIFQTLKIGFDDIHINLKEGFIKVLDTAVAKASTFNFD